MSADLAFLDTGDAVACIDRVRTMIAQADGQPLRLRAIADMAQAKTTWSKRQGLKRESDLAVYAVVLAEQALGRWVRETCADALTRGRGRPPAHSDVVTLAEVARELGVTGPMPVKWVDLSYVPNEVRDGAFLLASDDPAKDFSRAEMIRAGREFRVQAKPRAEGPAAVPAGPPRPTYGMVYAEPPWGDLSVQEMAAAPVAEMAEESCVLLIWCSPTHLAEALWLLQEWGFAYRTALAWQPGRAVLEGDYGQEDFELALVGERGAVEHVADLPSTVTLEPLKTGDKPARFAQMVEATWPGRSVVSLWRDWKRPGWEAFTAPGAES